MIVPVNAVGVTIALLDAKLPTIHPGTPFVSSTFPGEDYDEVVRVDRIHGAINKMVTDDAFMMIECWARQRPGVNGDVEAETLANHVRAVLLDSRSETHGGAFVRYWKDAGASTHPDPDRPSMVRWQVIGTLGLAVKR
ncbi:hypothetical protein [Nocardia sp. NPDC004260]